ncbi:MAG: thioredoxin family protein [Deltaproteobacteria bacterium]|nr:thioredoxin family protein [Deltaproteobacteria bacterium]
MASRRVFLFIAAAFLAVTGLVSLWNWSVGRIVAGGFQPDLAALPPQAPPLAAGERVTFLELGSVGCKPCEAMVPVMDAVRRKFGGQVEVTFHNVRKDPALAGRYRVSLIPTQVFLDARGREVFRHEGYFPEGGVVAVLQRMGVR